MQVPQRDPAAPLCLDPCLQESDSEKELVYTGHALPGRDTGPHTSLGDRKCPVKWPPATSEISPAWAQTWVARRDPTGPCPAREDRHAGPPPRPPGPSPQRPRQETPRWPFARKVPGAFSTKMTLESCRKLWPDSTILFPPSTGQLAALCFSTRGSSWADRWAAGTGTPVRQSPPPPGPDAPQRPSPSGTSASKQLLR